MTAVPGYSGAPIQTGTARPTFTYRCRHMTVAAPVILVQVRCLAGCEMGR